MNESGPQPIEPTNIEAYVNLMGHDDPDDRLDLMFFLQALDLEYCRVIHARIQAEREKALEKAKKGRR